MMCNLTFLCRIHANTRGGRDTKFPQRESFEMSLQRICYGGTCIKSILEIKTKSAAGFARDRGRILL